MKKKFACLMMSLLFCVSALAGCSLVTRVDAKYYNATVATLTYEDGTVEEISKRQLLVAYNSYGYNYVDSYGYEMEDAIYLTLDSLIETRVTIHTMENYYADLGEELLNDAEKTYLWQETYDAVMENLREYYNDVTGNTDSDEEDDDDASDSIFSDYEREAELTKTKSVDANGKVTYSYSITRTNTTSSTRNSTTVLKTADGVAYDFEYEVDGTYTFQEIMYEKIESLTTSTDSGSKNWKAALAEYVSQVRENYDYEDLGTAKECFMFEMDRIYNILKDNYIVQKFTEIYDVEEYGDGSIASLSVYDILQYYSGKVRAAYTDYQMTNTEPDVLNDLGSTYYIPDGSNASTYFSVAYIKIEFSDEEAKKVADCLDETSELHEYKNPQEIDELLEQMYANLSVNVRDSKTGEETDKTLTVAQLYALISSTLGENVYLTESTDTTYKEGSNDDDTDYSYMVKVDAFRDFLYLYNDDDTLKNADYNAVFGVDVNGNVLLNDDFSDYDEEYQEAISDAIKELYANGTAQIGNITEFVRTDDGVYLFFYAGKIENLFTVTENFDVSGDPSNIEVLTSAKLNVFSSKTVFDAIYETLYSDPYSTYETLSVTAMLSKVERVLQEDQISDLY